MLINSSNQYINPTALSKLKTHTKIEHKINHITPNKQSRRDKGPLIFREVWFFKGGFLLLLSDVVSGAEARQGRSRSLLPIYHHGALPNSGLQAPSRPAGNEDTGARARGGQGRALEQRGRSKTAPGISWAGVHYATLFLMLFCWRGCGMHLYVVIIIFFWPIYWCIRSVRCIFIVFLVLLYGNVCK